MILFGKCPFCKNSLINGEVFSKCLNCPFEFKESAVMIMFTINKTKFCIWSDDNSLCNFYEQDVFGKLPDDCFDNFYDLIKMILNFS